jgi:uncharacterized membrane protein
MSGMTHVERQTKSIIHVHLMALFAKILCLTLSLVLLDTGTNFPAVRLNCLLAMILMMMRECWKGTGAPTQLLSQTASLTLFA